MRLRFWVVVISLFVLLFIARGFLDKSQKEDKPLDTVSVPPTNVMELMTPVPAQDDALAIKLSGLKFYVDELHLNGFEAAIGDLSLCGDDQICLKNAKKIKNWICAIAVCDGTDKSKRPVDCFVQELDSLPKDVLDQQINALICPFIESPTPERRRSLLNYITNDTEDHFVVHGAFLLALKKSAAACEDYIEDYVGSYGPQWTYVWYKAWSGCRILARERTREQEEKDFHRWLGAVHLELSKCSDVVNSKMREACEAYGAFGATSPRPVIDNE